jgi:hypothetical protein
MVGIRTHVRLVAALWLSCQAIAFVAAPFVLCNDHGVMSQMADAHECDPQHHHHGHSDEAAISCRCTVSDAALGALMLDAGILPGDIVVETRLVASPVVLSDYAAPTRSQHPDTPPPRA